MTWITVISKLGSYIVSGLKAYDLLNKTGVINRVRVWIKRKTR
jgi:hypothetical protein